MKVTVTFKDSNVLDYLDRYGIGENNREVFDELAGKYFRYGEYVDIEFDLEKGTARLLEAR